MPNQDGEAVDRAIIMAGIDTSGYKFGKGSKSMNSLNQALSTLKKTGLALVPVRGKYTLSDQGEKAKKTASEPQDAVSATISSE